MANIMACIRLAMQGLAGLLTFVGMITLATLGLASTLYTSEHFFIKLAVSLSIDFYGKVTGKAVILARPLLRKYPLARCHHFL